MTDDFNPKIAATEAVTLSKDSILSGFVFCGSECIHQRVEGLIDIRIRHILDQLKAQFGLRFFCRASAET
jgi:hypothetical protein